MHSGPTFIDLFCGAGGLSLGLCQAGYRPVVGIDRVETALATYERNLAILGAVGLRSDLRNPDFPSHLQWFLDSLRLSNPDVIVAGLPQQTFSIARKTTARIGEGESLLLHNLIAVLQRLLPRAVLLEALPTFPTAKGGAEYNALLDGLAKVGYRTEQWRVNAADFGVPQRRDRVYLVGIRESAWPIPAPSPSHGGGRLPWVTIEQALSDLPPAMLGRAGLDQCPISYPALPVHPYQFAMRSFPAGWPVEWDQRVDNHIAVPHAEDVVERMSYIKPGGNLGALVRDETAPERMRRGKAFNSRYQRPYVDRVCYTVTSHCMEDILHYSENRCITPREAARLQSFPDWYTFEGSRSGHHGSSETMDQYEQIGQATPPIVARALAEALKPIL